MASPGSKGKGDSNNESHVPAYQETPLRTRQVLNQ